MTSNYKSRNNLIMKNNQYFIENDILLNHIKTLSLRIDDRFPDSSLNRQIAEFYNFSKNFEPEIEKTHNNSKKFF